MNIKFNRLPVTHRTFHTLTALDISHNNLQAINTFIYSLSLLVSIVSRSSQKKQLCNKYKLPSKISAKFQFIS